MRVLFDVSSFGKSVDRAGLIVNCNFFQVDIYAGSVFLYEAVGWNIYISAACILAITAVYTVLGKIVGFKRKLHDLK